MSKRKTLQRRAVTKFKKMISKLTPEQLAELKAKLDQATQPAITDGIIKTQTK